MGHGLNWMEKWIHKTWLLLHGSFVCDASTLQLKWTPGHNSHTWTKNISKIIHCKTLSTNINCSVGKTKIKCSVEFGNNLCGRHWRHSFSWKPRSSPVLNFFPHPRHTFICNEFFVLLPAGIVADQRCNQKIYLILKTHLVYFVIM